VEEGQANKLIYSHMVERGKKYMDTSDKSFVVEGTELIPDGVFSVASSNPQGLNYKLQIVDTDMS
jgi:hypothetical protein